MATGHDFLFILHAHVILFRLLNGFDAFRNDILLSTEWFCHLILPARTPFWHANECQSL